jgi:hypothetical protein
MKALAAEMVQNFGGRLEPLGIAVRELTGDMQLSKSEILKTQVPCLFKVREILYKFYVLEDHVLHVIERFSLCLYVCRS